MFLGFIKPLLEILVILNFFLRIENHFLIFVKVSKLVLGNFILRRFDLKKMFFRCCVDPL